MSHTGTGFRLTGKHVLAMLIAFFGIIFAVNGVLVYLAQTSWTGLMKGNGYEASIKYNKEAEKARKMLAKGWRTQILVPRDGRVMIELKDKAGQPLSGLVAKVKIGRPVGERDDREFAFRDNGAGRYVIPEPLKPGAWKLWAEFFRGGELVWRTSAKFVVPER